MRELNGSELCVVCGGDKSDEYLATGVVMGAAAGLLVVTGAMHSMGFDASPWLYGAEAILLAGAIGAHVLARHYNDDLNLAISV